MLKTRKTEDLHSMYDQLGRVNDGHATMAKCMSAHLREELGKVFATDEKKRRQCFEFKRMTNF